MPAAVYSTQLASAQGFSGGPTAIYAVPMGYRDVITCISLQVGVNALPGALLVRAGPGEGVICSFGGEASAFNSGLVQEGRWVLNVGDIIEFETVGTPLWVGDYFVSGYHLALP